MRSHSNISFKSEDNNLEKEILAGNAIAMQMQQQETASSAPEVLPMETEVIQQSSGSRPDNDTSVNTAETTKEKEDLEAENTANAKEKPIDSQSTTSQAEKTEESHLMHISSSSPKSGVTLSGTLKLMKPFEVQKSSSHKRLIDEFEDNDYGGCFPRVLAAIWSTIFD